ncbi:Holliday junction DNA helicase RuvA [Weissella viridescens]|uniref:Holliday junction DNA helicase RuvA n=1 Tax=Weissella viridescens TaxID=1629 RepID=A0A380P9D7_WEIVI|nr:Holliday junction DNA helicase RuvA [Weissella viridescens]
MDLQNKVDELPFQTQMDQFELDVPKPKAGSDLDEALQALEALGYAKKDLKRIEKQLQTEALADTAAYVSAGLKLLQ